MSLVLGIETSCDETAAAVVDDRRAILADVVRDQLDAHRDYGGVVPEIAARAHLEVIDRVVARAMDDAGIRVGRAGRGRGDRRAGADRRRHRRRDDRKGDRRRARSPLLRGQPSRSACPHATADGCRRLPLSRAAGVGRALPIRRGRGGGAPPAARHHRSTTRWARPSTRWARCWGSAIPAVPRWSARQRRETQTASRCPAPCAAGRVAISPSRASRPPSATRSKGCRPAPLADRGCHRSLRRLPTGGGRRNGRSLRQRDRALPRPLPRRRNPGGGRRGRREPDACGRASKPSRESTGFAFIAPPPRLCTDNAAMVAWTGVERLALGLADGLDFAPRPRWPLEDLAAG